MFTKKPQHNIFPSRYPPDLNDNLLTVKLPYTHLLYDRSR